MIFQNNYGTWFPGTIEGVYLASEDNLACFEVDYGINDYIPSHNVRCNAVGCQDCEDVMPGHYMEIHRDPAVHLGHEVRKIFSKISNRFFAHSKCRNQRCSKIG